MHPSPPPPSQDLCQTARNRGRNEAMPSSSKKHTQSSGFARVNTAAALQRPHSTSAHYRTCNTGTFHAAGPNALAACTHTHTLVHHATCRQPVGGSQIGPPIGHAPQPHCKLLRCRAPALRRSNAVHTGYGRARACGRPLCAPPPLLRLRHPCRLQPMPHLSRAAASAAAACTPCGVLASWLANIDRRSSRNASSSGSRSPAQRGSA